MVLAGDSKENDEKIQAFRAAQLHTRQAQQFNIMPAFFTLLQEEINKLFGNAKEEVTIYLCFPVSQLYNPPIPSHVSNPS